MREECIGELLENIKLLDRKQMEELYDIAILKMANNIKQLQEEKRELKEWLEKEIKNKKLL